jgi:hypothetical protein
MMLSVPASAVSFSIPDDRWQFCDCESFRPTIDFYMYPPEPGPHTDTVPIAEIEPPLRSLHSLLTLPRFGS